jgi:hypothetical protein
VTQVFRRSPHDREIVRLAVPALGALAAEPLYLLADTAIVGHLGTNPLAGLAVSGTVLTAAFSVFNFLAYSTTASVARQVGAEPAGGGRVRHDGRWLVGLGLRSPPSGCRRAAHRRRDGGVNVAPRSPTYASASPGTCVPAHACGCRHLRGMRTAHHARDAVAATP